MFTCPPTLLFELNGRGYVEDIWRQLVNTEKSYLLSEGDFSVDFELLEEEKGYSVASISGNIADQTFTANVSHSTEYFTENLFWRGSSISLSLQVWALVPAGATATVTTATAGSINMESSRTIHTVSADAGTFLGRAVNPSPSQANGDFPFDDSKSWTTQAEATKLFPQYAGWTYRSVFYSSLSSSQTIVADWNQVGHGKIVTEYYAWLEVDDVGMAPIPVISELESSGYHGVGNQLKFTANDSYDPDDNSCQIQSLNYEWKLIDWKTDKVISSGSEVDFWHTFDAPGRFKLQLTVIDDEGVEASTFENLDIGLDFLTAVVHGWTPFESEIDQTNTKTIEFSEKYSDFAFNSKPLYAEESTVPFTWDSHTAFGEAITFQVLHQVLYRMAGAFIKRNAIVPAAWTSSMAILAEAFAISYSSSSRLRAKFAAQTLAKTIGEPNQDRADDKSFVVNFIGYSRGGFVATEASQILESRYNISTCGVDVLDATGFDWPELISIVFDGNPIPNSSAKLTNNWRVQDGLFSVAGRYLASAMAESVSGLAKKVGVPDVQQFFSESATIEEMNKVLEQLMDQKDLKAPVRLDFNGNTTIVDESVRSNHSNVDDIYFASPEYLQQSPVYGDNYKTCIGIGEEEADYPLNPDPTSDDLASQHGGSYSLPLRKLAKLKEIADSISTQTYVPDAWVQSLQKLYFHPRAIESLVDGLGNYTVIADTQDKIGGIQLTAKASESAIRQFIQVERSGDKFVASIEFDRDSIAEDSTIEIAIGDQVLKRLNIRDIEGQVIEADIPDHIWGVTEFTVRIKSYSDSSGDTVLITDTRLYSQMRPVELIANQMQFLVGTSPEFILQAWDSWSASKPLLAAIYRESNAIEGLQIGEGGDQWIADRQFESVYSFAVPGDWTVGETVTVYASVQNAASSSLVVTASSTAQSSQPLLQNPHLRFDVDRDGTATPLDALIVINDLNRNGIRWVPTDTPSHLMKSLDVSGNQYLDPVDALQIINHLNRQSGLRLEGESLDSDHITSRDQLFSTLGSFAEEDRRKRRFVY